jgi:hypothetical protein
MDPPVVIVLTRLDHFPAVLSSTRGLECSLATVTMRTAFTEAGGIVKSHVDTQDNYTDVSNTRDNHL